MRGKDYEVDGTDAALPHAPYPMKGVGPFTHTNPQDRPAEIFGGKNTLHFGGKFAPYVLLPIIPKSDMTVRAAIIGLGRWGRSLVNAVHGKTDAIRFTAAYTRTRASAEDFCRDKNIPLLDRFEDALADPNIDAVVLATPHSQHAEQVMAAAVAGKHIHVEKPLTLDRPSAEAAVAAAKRAGIVLAVGFNRRFHPSVVEIRKRLADGQLGKVMSMVGTHTTSTGQFIAADNWRAQPDEAPGGAHDRGRRAFDRRT